MKLKLSIRNIHDLVPALSGSAIFSQRGGILGSASDVTWQIQDHEGSIPENAAKIVVTDNHFTIESFPGAKIYINGATSPITTEQPIIISDKDTLYIGELECLAEAGEKVNSESNYSIKSMSSFASNSTNGNDSLVIDGEYEEASVPEIHEAQDDIEDPLDVLDRSARRSNSVDPIEMLNAQKESTGPADFEYSVQQNTQATQGDGSNLSNASIIPKNVKRDRYGFEEAAAEFDHDTSDTIKAERAQIDMEHPVDHVALRPLSRALGLPLGDMNATQAANVLSEIGGALRAAVGGINEIYKSRDAMQNRFPLTTLHMHPVEDNPLRFANDTDEALHALFAKRGAVHLSAPAAMTEAVDHFAAHQIATERSIDKALEAVLLALTPKALERRFRSYAPNEHPEDGQERDAWCWGMYKAYFSELRSQRQKGLQMLFWEVFQHEYQSIMRSHELLGTEDENDE